MYLRETRRTNRYGSMVRYLQLAHNERHPQTGSPVAKVIHNFGRAETVARAGLVRLVFSISRFLDPAAAVAAAVAEVEVLDSRRLSAVWTLDRLGERLGLGAALRTVAVGSRLDGEAVGRVCFAVVRADGQPALLPSLARMAGQPLQHARPGATPGADLDRSQASVAVVASPSTDIETETLFLSVLAVVFALGVANAVAPLLRHLDTRFRAGL